MTDEQMEDYLDKVSKQKTAYKELDKFEPGQGGLQYFPVPKEEHDAWKREKNLKDMEAYEKQQKHKLDVLALREELTRSNGHNKPQVELNKGNSALTYCNDCNNTVGTCDCRDNPKWAKIEKGESERYPNLIMPGKEPIKMTEEQIKDHLTMKIPISRDGKEISITKIIKDKINPDHCDLKKDEKKKTTRKRVSKKK